MKAFDPQWIAFRNVVKTGSVCILSMARLHRSMYLFQIYVSLKFWTSGFAGVIFHGYTVQFETIQVNAITARGTVYNKVFGVHCNWNGIGLAI